MSAPTVQMVHPPQLRQRRAQLLASVGVSEDELRERGEEYTLTPDLIVVLDQLNEIDFLLGG